MNCDSWLHLVATSCAASVPRHGIGRRIHGTPVGIPCSSGIRISRAFHVKSNHLQAPGYGPFLWLHGPSARITSLPSQMTHLLCKIRLSGPNATFGYGCCAEGSDLEKALGAFLCGCPGSLEEGPLPRPLALSVDASGDVTGRNGKNPGEIQSGSSRWHRKDVLS